jgi:uncharacterized membrane protein YkoI
MLYDSQGDIRSTTNLVLHRRNLMRSNFGRIGLAGLMLISVGGIVQAKEKEEKIAIDKLPKAVIEAVKKRFPDAKLESAEKETEGGKIVYEVELEQKDEELEVELTADGTILEIEQEISVKDVPKAVHDALMAKYPKSEFEKAEKVTKVKDGKDQPAVYEVEVETADDKEYEVTVSAEGKIIEVEEEDDDDKDDGK